jgi:outer membrane protein, adhesin transport system
MSYKRDALMMRIGSVVVVLCLLSGALVRAEDLTSALVTAVATNSRMRAANADIEAARLNKMATFGSMLPTVEFGGWYGAGTFDSSWQDSDVDVSTNLSTSFDNTSVRLVQPLITLGAQRIEYRKARTAHLRSCVEGSSVRQDLILEAVSTYLRLKQLEKVADYARASVDNVRKQTEMEEARFEKGGGVSTDVLQAKTQLFRAEAQLKRAEGRIMGAQNAVQRVFSRPASVISELQKTDLTAGKPIPADLEQAEAVALKLSPYLKAAELNVQKAKEGLSSERYANIPKVNGVLEADWRHDYGGEQGGRVEQLAKIEVFYNFNLGMASINATRSARQQLVAAEERFLDARKEVLEQVRNAWQSLCTAKETAEILRKQEGVADEFLTLARKERTLGRRSLLDVLDGEMTLISARSEAASAEADIEIYTYQLLRAMGVLDIALDEKNFSSKP